MPTITDIEWQGALAKANGNSLDDCPYRRADRRCAWVRGWHKGEAQGKLVRTVFSPYEQRQGQAALKGIRAILEKPDCKPIDV